MPSDADITYLSPGECAVVLSHAETDALLALLEQAQNAGFTPGVGLRLGDAEEAGYRIVQQRWRDQDPYSRAPAIVAVTRRPGKAALDA